MSRCFLHDHVTLYGSDQYDISSTADMECAYRECMWRVTRVEDTNACIAAVFSRPLRRESAHLFLHAVDTGSAHQSVLGSNCCCSICVSRKPHRDFFFSHALLCFRLLVSLDREAGVGMTVSSTVSNTRRTKRTPSRSYGDICPNLLQPKYAR